MGHSQSEVGTGVRPGYEVTADRSRLHLRLADVERQHRDRVPAGAGDRHTASPSEPGLRAPVVEAGLDTPAHRNLTGNALDAPNHFTGRGEPIARKRHRVGHPYDSGAGGESRLEDVGVGKVTAFRVMARYRRERKRPSAFRVEQAREDTARVEVRQAEPVD